MPPVARLLATALFCALLVPAPNVRAQTRAPQPRDLVVNEIFYDPPDAGERQEFVEILNRSEEPADLSAVSFSDANRNLVPVTDSSRTLAPGGYAVLVRDGAAFAAAFPGVAFIEPPSWPTLNNGGDEVSLYVEGDGEPVVIDRVPYGPSWGGSDNEHSLERRDPAGPSTSAVNFGSSTAPGTATPGAENTLFARDTEPPQPVFAEAAGARVDVFFNEPLEAASVHPSAFALGGVAPQEAALIEGATGARLTFSSAVNAQTITVRDVQDRSGNVLEEATLRLAFAAKAGDLVINEVLYDPLSDDFDNRPDQPEYVELFNPTERALRLDGLFWTDVPNEDGEADTTRFGAERTAVAPGGFAVVYAAGGDGSLTEAFPRLDAAANSLTLVPVARSSLGLLNSGDLIHLQRPAEGDGAPVTLDSVRYAPRWHNPSLEDATGLSLERIQPGGPSNDPDNWESSTAEAGGTPGRPNAAFLAPGEAPPEGTLTVQPSPFYPEGDGPTAIRFTLSEAASLVRVRIFDSYGRRVRTLERAQLAGRTGQIPWNGRGEDGERLRIGVYIVLLEALDARGGTAEALKEPVVIARPFD